jgi:hypothetical protein
MKLISEISPWRTPILPELRTLRWNVSLSVLHILSFLCPSVEHLIIAQDEFALQKCQFAEATVIGLVSVLLPNLKNLTATRDDFPVTRHAFAKAIPQMSRLEALDIECDIDGKILLLLSTFPQLKTVCVFIAPVSPLPRLGPGCFPCLEDFRITTSSNGVIPFISALVSPRLHTFHMSLDNLAINYDLLAETLSICTIVDFSLELFPGPGDSLPPFHFSTFLARFSHHPIKHFDLYTSSIVLRDADVETIVTSWPLLQSFEIVKPSPPVSSLGALRLFAYGSPDLQELQLSVDASAEIDIDSFDSLLPSPSRLSQLNLGNSTCSNAESMSTFLLRTFPHMQELLVWTHSLLGGDEIPDVEEHKLKWVIVEQRLSETLLKVTR